MLVRCVADLHGYLPYIEPCDLLIVAGDVSPLAFDRDIPQVQNWLATDFSHWLSSIPAKRIIGIAGNHDFVFASEQPFPRLPWTYLKDHEANVDGLRVYGTPWVPNLAGWAFSDVGEEACRRPFADIPEGLDILVSHGPPAGVLDVVYGRHIGSTTLANSIAAMPQDKRPRFLVCGHIHEGYGLDDDTIPGTTVLNCALNDEYYHLTEALSHSSRYSSVRTLIPDDSRGRHREPGVIGL